MAYNPDTDPVIIAARERGRAQGLEFSRKLNAALERVKTAMAQNTQMTQTAPSAPNGGDAAEGAKPGNTAIQEIEAPFELSADDIVEAIEQDGKTIVHNVMDGERVLFSTVSKPLAFAFIQGHNAAAKAQRDAKTDKGDDGDGEEGKAARRGPAEVDPKSPPSTRSGAAGDNAENANAGNNPRALSTRGSDTPGSQAAGEGRRAERPDPPPRKRVML